MRVISTEEIRLRCLEAVPTSCAQPDHVISYASELLHWVLEGKTIEEAERERMEMLNILNPSNYAQRKGD